MQTVTGFHQGVLELMTSYIFMPRSRERQKQIAMAEAEAVGMPGEAMNVPWAAKTLKKIIENNSTKMGCRLVGRFSALLVHARLLDSL